MRVTVRSHERIHREYATAPNPELTDDVDVVVEVTSPVEFQVDPAPGHRCQGGHIRGCPDLSLLLGGLRVDAMSADESILGFSNRWYPLAMAIAKERTLPNGITIQAIDSPVFLATKLEAYSDRGSDCLSSKDVVHPGSQAPSWATRTARSSAHAALV